MERYNPFADYTNDSKPYTRNSSTPLSCDESNKDETVEISPIKVASRYSTSFPDPLSDIKTDASTTETEIPARESSRVGLFSYSPAPSSRSIDDANVFKLESKSQVGARQSSQTGAFTSFLSRATSVTSGSVSDRVSGAMGSMKCAVDTLSSQIQQAVPTNLNINERLSSTASNIIGSGDQLASKFSSTTFSSQFNPSSSNQTSMPMISRQRVILIVEDSRQGDWVQQFTSYHKLTSGLNQTQSVLGSLFTSATVQIGSSSLLSSTGAEGGDLVEQADSKNLTILANQGSATAIVCITNSKSTSRGQPNPVTKIIRPEYVVARQRVGLDNCEHLKAFVKGLSYSMIPMFEPGELWSLFQDRQLIFSHLLHIQRTIGRENFPLIPQVYCQTHQDLINYIQSCNIKLPCLVRTGPRGAGKLKVESLQMLRDLASIMATIGLSCTIEPYLSVKYDLLIQKLGTNLKLYRRMRKSSGELTTNEDRFSKQDLNRYNSSSKIGSLSKQGSVAGSSVFAGLMTGNQTAQMEHRGSIIDRSSEFERMTDMSSRYRFLLESVSREFDGKLEAFRIRVIITDDDREYIVGLDDCSMDFVGDAMNQDEDRRAFVELVISHMNTILPKHDGRSSSSQVPNMTEIGHRSHISTSPQRSSKADVPSSTNSSYVRSQPRLGGRSQSVSMNKSDRMLDEESGMSKVDTMNRRSSDRLDCSGLPSSPQNLSSTENLGISNQAGSDSSNINNRQASLGQTFFGQTSSAFNNFQRQSLSFFKRLDSMTANDLLMGATNTPPQSAKSDRGFISDRASLLNMSSSGGYNLKNESSTGDSLSTKVRDGFKSQSIDVSGSISPENLRILSKSNEVPRKPPPPKLMPRSNRQGSLSSVRGETSDIRTPNQTRQNSMVSAKDSQDVSRNRVVRQNSALSAFEQFDAGTLNNSESLEEPYWRTQGKSIADTRDSSIAPGYQSGSITSGDSSSTGDTTGSGEDTMKNLKKTFAGIFGDKQPE